MSKEAMKLALEALEYIEHNYMSLPAPAEKAITALREALAEQPAIKQDLTPEQTAPGSAHYEDGDVFERIAARKQQPAQPQKEPVALPEKTYEFVLTPEPVKWHHPECEGQCIACLIEQVVKEAYGSLGLGYLQRHLTSPPQRKPLTDEEIEKVWGIHRDDDEHFDITYERDITRAIEAELQRKNDE